jgi:hypothetical protein
MFWCVGCDATIEHPDGEDGCETVNGYCAVLIRAGWQSVWARIILIAPDDQPDRHVFSKGCWICPACVERYVGPPARPRHRRRQRRSERARSEN